MRQNKIFDCGPTGSGELHRLRVFPSLGLSSGSRASLGKVQWLEGANESEIYSRPIDLIMQLRVQVRMAMPLHLRRELQMSMQSLQAVNVIRRDNRSQSRPTK